MEIPLFTFTGSSSDNDLFTSFTDQGLQVQLFLEVTTETDENMRCVFLLLHLGHGFFGFLLYFSMVIWIENTFLHALHLYS